MTQKNDSDQKRLEHSINEEGKASYWLDVDRMLNEGLGGGVVSEDNGLVDASRPLTKESRPFGDHPYDVQLHKTPPRHHTDEKRLVSDITEETLFEDRFEATMDEP